jgi:predicted nuclease of restriction endonuclease-like (RecB) superfamily
MYLFYYIISENPLILGNCYIKIEQINNIFYIDKVINPKNNKEILDKIKINLVDNKEFIIFTPYLKELLEFLDIKTLTKVLNYN